MLAKVLVIAAIVTHLDVGFCITSVIVLLKFWKKDRPSVYFLCSSSFFCYDLDIFLNLSLIGSLMNIKLPIPRDIPKIPMN